jgi:hypothetical protein
MSSIRHKNFNRPGFLKRIQSNVLRRLILPYRVYFESRGLELDPPGGGQLDCDQLSRILATPDQDTPGDLISVIELCDAVCCCDTFEELVAHDHARDERVLNPEHSHADAVILTWLEEPEVIERIFNRAALELDRSLFVYKADQPLRTHAFNPARLRKLENTLRPAFEQHLRGDSCKVAAFERSGGMALVIRHGDPIQKTDAISDSGDAQPLVFRPECLDLAFYDSSSNEWRISGRARWLQELYSRQFARSFHAEGAALVRSNSFTLEPIRQHGLAALDHQTHEVRNVRLMELQVVLGGATIQISGRNLDDAMQILQSPLFQFGQMKSARLAFTLANRRNALPVTIHCGRGSVRGDIDHPAIENWLEETAFLTHENPTRTSHARSAVAGD